MNKACLSLILTTFCTMMMAVPAKRGVWKTFKLADGTEVRAELRGDEHVRYWRAEDGCTFIDLAPALASENAGLRAFELMRYDMRLHPITLTEAMQVADFCSNAG